MGTRLPKPRNKSLQQSRHVWEKRFKSATIGFTIAAARGMPFKISLTAKQERRYVISDCSLKISMIIWMITELYERVSASARLLRYACLVYRTHGSSFTAVALALLWTRQQVFLGQFTLSFGE